MSPGCRARALPLHIWAAQMADSSNTVFDPEVLKALAAAYDDACAALHLNHGDPRAIIVAKKIIEDARHGERDSIRLREAVLTEMRVAVDDFPATVLGEGESSDGMTSCAETNQHA